jgi:glycosyltransferase involved in cell wall biosynthesis
MVRNKSVNPTVTPLKIAMIGTRGVPAAYGGFETAIEEIGQRLVSEGHEVTVYCRTKEGSPKLDSYLGMKLKYLPAVRSKVVETLSHTGFSVLSMLFSTKQDVAFVFNAANSPFLPLIRVRRVPTIVHVDGLEWKRGKWGPGGRRYYRMAEQLSVQWGDALIADAQGIADYYHDEFSVKTELISYGTHIIRNGPFDRLAELGLEPGKYHLVVARFEPENHVDVIVAGYTQSGATLPLVVVGSAPYAAEYTDRIAGAAAADPRIKMLGGVWDQEQLDQLYTNALTYLHGHSVGGTNPSLLRAMGAGTTTIAWNVVFNSEVLGGDGRYFFDAESVGDAICEAESDVSGCEITGERLQNRAAALYNWDDVAKAYGELAQRVAAGYSTRSSTRARRIDSAWSQPDTMPIAAPIAVTAKASARGTSGETV